MSALQLKYLKVIVYMFYKIKFKILTFSMKYSNNYLVKIAFKNLKILLQK